MKVITMLQTRKNSQSGMASILITMIMMIVISLIVLSLSQISRNERGSALDQQLSSQAFYAAESGVNDAIRAINPPNSYLTTISASGKSQCAPDPNGPLSNGPPYGPNINQVDPTDPNIEYTCLLINPRPASLQYGNVGLGTPVVVPIETVDSSGNPIPPTSVDISWQNNSGGTTIFASCPGNFPSVAVWSASKCGASVLRVDMVSVAAFGGGNRRSNLAQDTWTVFLHPHTILSPTITYSYPVNPANNGRIINAYCHSPPSGANIYACNISINGTGLGGLLADGKYYLRLQAPYGPQTVSITAYSGLNQLKFANAQVLIDSTGKATDTLRRIQVRVPLNGQVKYPVPFPVQSSSSICKRFTTFGPGDTNPVKALTGLSLGGQDTSACFGS